MASADSPQSNNQLENVLNPSGDHYQLHIKAVSSMCRICGDRHMKFSQSLNKNIKRKPVSNSADHIMKYFGIDVRTDQSETHPKYICDKCYNKIRYKAKNEEECEFYKSKARYFNDLWMSCKSGGPTDLCKVCELHEEQSMKRRPKKLRKKKDH